MMALTGVPAAKEFNDSAKEKQRKAPGLAVIHNWHDVPGVKEKIAGYKEDLPMLSESSGQEINGEFIAKMLEHMKNV